jgi:hypothetical protein
MDLDFKLKNWENFCQHQLGDWHGTWTFYSAQGQFAKSFQCLRSFQSSNLEKVEHQNHYFYDDGNKKTETFGPYIKPEMKGTYLDNGFSWGAKSLDDPFFFETGFRADNQRVSVVGIYAKNVFTQALVILETLGKFKDFSQFSWPTQFKGKTQSINSELVVSGEEEQIYRPLSGEILFSFPGNIILACPQTLTSNQVDLCVDWLVTPSLLYRGIRSFNSDQFKQFTLQTFTTF